MKALQLKIRKFLFITLISILGVLLILYIAFCRGGDYNSAHINEPTTKVEATTEAPSVPDEEEPTEIVEEPEEIQEETQKDEVEDISIASKKPIIDDDDIPPFLRKLRR